MKTSQCGFTLIEVVVAMIILGLSLGSVFQLLHSSRRNSIKADETLTAIRLIRNLLVNPAMIDAAINDREVVGTVEVGPQSLWRYSFSALPLEFASGRKREIISDMYELNLCLFHETEYRKKAFCVKQWHRR